jgi:RecA/RadA recombinase
MGLHEKFREKVSKLKVSGVANIAEFDVLYPTGFLALDYLNGTVVHVESEERNFTYNAVGIVDGSANTFIGRSSSGKSTLAIQIAGKIVKPFIKNKMDSGIYIDDIEGSLPQVRKEFLLGLSQEEITDYVEIRNSGITTENLYQRIQAIHDIKVENRKDYEYDSGLFDTYGNRIFKLVPTVYIIDSLPMLLPEEVAEKDELSGSMTASSIAKSNTQLLKKVAQLCKEANIILFTINHILDEIQMGFIPKAAQISGLKQGERLPGGKAAIYLANNMFRTDDSLTLKADKDFGIDGSVVTLTLIKSRTNATKRSVPLIFNKTEGYFDNILSLFMLLKNEGRIKGAGVGSYLEGCPDVKFSQKNFKQQLESHKELRDAFSQECYNVLCTFLSDTRNRHSEDDSLEDDIFNQISSMGLPKIN